MKIFNSILFSTFLLLGVSSCELKEELKNRTGGTDQTTMGVLSLELSAKDKLNNVTKASDVSTENFNVDIVRSDGTLYRSFESYAALKEEMPLEIPVGRYMIKASSPGEILSISKFPYFAGDKEILIEENLTSTTTVSCVIQNVKLAISLSDKFTEAFTSSFVTLTSGANLAYTINSDDLDPIYLDASKVVDKISLLIKGVKENGGIVQIKRQLAKPADYGNGFGAGDFLDITLDATDEDVDPDPEEPAQSNVSIRVSVDLSFDESDETITVELTDDDEPGPVVPEVKPTLSCPYFSNPIIMSPTSPAPEVVDVNIQAENKIANLLVTITSDNESFMEMLMAMEINETFDMANLSDVQKENFSAIGLPFEGIKGETSYTFSIGSLIGLLGSFEGTHTFAVEVVDEQGGSAKDAFEVNVSM